MASSMQERAEIEAKITELEDARAGATDTTIARAVGAWVEELRKKLEEPCNSVPESGK